MVKFEEKLLSWIICIGFFISIFILIAVLFIIHLNIDVSFIIELLVVNIDIVAIFISGSIVVVTVGYNINTKNNLNHQILENLTKEYGSAEMMYALQRLWTFYRYECEEKEKELKRKYKQKSEEQIRNLRRSSRYEGKIDRVKNSIAYQRRLVSNFYYHLANIHDLGMLPDDILFSIWGIKELEILKEIIIPLEEVQATMYKTYRKAEKIEKIQKLKDLYDDCKSHPR